MRSSASPRTPRWEPTHREMETLSELIDCLCEGDLGRCGGVAMQRYKALEMALNDKSWEVAKELEVVDHQTGGLATEEERHRGSRRRLQEVRLANALSSVRGQRMTGESAAGR